MKIEARANYIAFLVIGIIFILLGGALNELDLIKEANSWSVGEGDDLEKWYEFLNPFIGDKNNGLPPPWDN